MGKAKRLKATQQVQKPYTKHSGKPQSKASARRSHHASRASATKNPPPKHPLPFEPENKILLVGEGDFSFAASLAVSHSCAALTATTLEPSRDALLAKYPQAEAHLSTLSSPNHSILYAIDATKLGRPATPGAASLRKAKFDVVVFNFPHVGGQSTDVNRQVRANQSLIATFLESAQRVLSPGGAVVVTIFEGQPYELWGLRNLARHVGLVVERSMRFDKDRFPGYRHARTLGNVEGGWKGEEREARMYVLRAKDGLEAEAKSPGGNKQGKKKRKRGESSGSEDSD